MNIQAFFQLCDGKWISQRTTHQLLEQNNQSGRSDLWGEVLDATDGDVVTLCQQLNVDSSLALCGLRLRWSEVAEAYESKFKKKDEGSAVLVAIAAHQKSDASENSSAGRILRNINCANAAMGTFSIGLDEALTLRLEKAGTVSEERIWFASPNLRLRSSSIKKEDLVCITTFCSEIRMAAPAVAPSAETSTSQANAAN
jgi:CpeS-like protein